MDESIQAVVCPGPRRQFGHRRPLVAMVQLVKLN